MSTPYTTILAAAEVAAHLDDPQWVIVDCRFDLADTDAGEQAYWAGHIPGAVYAHLDRDLSGPRRATGEGGRHPLPAPAELARTFGATDFVLAGPDANAVKAIRELTGGGGVDWSFECVGHPALIRTCVDLLDWGGSCVLLGVPKFGSEASFVVNTLYNDKSILGCRYGAARPHHDIPLFIDLYKAGKLKLDELVSATYQPEQVQEALDAMHGGGLNRAVLTWI